MDKYIVTMLGEKDHGKSTLIGNLLIATGSTTDERVREARVKGKRWEPAYILDSFSEERENEMTIDTTRAELVHKGKMFELIDVPGHLELIKNMMSGASNGDFAVLMVSVKKGEGFRPQTRRHLFLSQMFGIKALAVAVNKMDIVDYDERVFEKAKREVGDYLRSINFDKPVFFVPVSAYNNENLVSNSGNMGWYKGLPLAGLLMDFAKRYYRRPKSGGDGVRAIVQDAVETDGSKALFCVLYNGTVRVGDTVRVEPDEAKARVKRLHLKGRSVRSASAHSNIALVLDKDVDVGRGSMIYGSSVRPHRKGTFTARMFVINGIRSAEAKRLFIRTNNNDIPLKGMRIESTLSPVTGNRSRGGGSIATNDSATVSIILARDYPLERYEEHNELGRFALYRGEEFVGVGIVE
ncbi:MAG: hypothetical protein KGH58_02655 [Candidatus Micrarchaeota archaeon]|nr:hypothetical protein [Candidatus Micrarchaeota archaeon]